VTSATRIDIPRKCNVFGVGVTPTTYDAALALVLDAANTHRPLCMTHLAVHGLMEARRDATFNAVLEDFDIVAPDGQPVRHALNLLYKTRIPENCRGPEFIVRVCRGAAQKGVGVYFYGSTSEVVEALKRNLAARYEGLDVVGAEPSLFRPLSDGEMEELAERINGSGCGVAFFGMGCPLQERFVHALKDRVHAVMIANGAAFEMHAGFRKMAPRWMQRLTLEWLYRLMQEPKRLFGRYLATNTAFLAQLALHYTGLKKTPRLGER